MAGELLASQKGLFCVELATDSSIAYTQIMYFTVCR